MATKKCVPAVLFTFISISLLVMLVMDPQHPGRSLLRQQQGPNATKIFQWLVDMGSWTSSEMILVADKSEPVAAISPNLSSCHSSLKYFFEGPINCCPPKPLSDEPVIDFQFPSESSPVRIRRPVHLLDNDFITKYSKAVEIMKSLPYDDPRSFMRQANLHCIACTGSYNQAGSNIGLSVHLSWLFFPWHRMFIYFHERILASLIEDDTFALPFWNWDAPEGMMMPDMFINHLPLVDMDRDKGNFPPKVIDLNFAPGDDKGLGPDELISANLALMYTQMVSGAKTSELFMGCPLKAGEDGQCMQPGTIELSPHNNVHSWVGSDKYPMREHMGIFYSSARDPVFYPHHSNIDRLWEAWRDLMGSKGEITDPDWLDSHFYFHNEHKQLVRIKIRDVLNITKLGYSFPKVDLPWLNARPKPCVDPKIARSVLNGINFPSNNFSSNFSPKGRSLEDIINVRVHRSKKDMNKKGEEVLVVYGIDIKRDLTGTFDVFVNAVDASSIGPESREFAGSFVNVPRGVTRVMNKDDVVVNTKINLKLGISELLEDLEADGDDNIWVTLVPRGGSGFNTTVDGIRIEHIV